MVLFLSAKSNSINEAFYMLLSTIFILALQSISVAQCQETELLEKLLANYSKSTRPLKYGRNSLEIYMDSIQLMAIESFDEMTATLALEGWLIIVMFSSDNSIKRIPTRAS